jgi:pyruvate dehydrogenase E1 component alpha subunit
VTGPAEYDDARYVPRDLLESWKTQDRILRSGTGLKESDFLSDEERDTILNRIRAELDAAVEYAETSLYPDGASALGCVHNNG